MKESEIVTGESYRFRHTDVEHRKFMIGTVVTVIGRRKGRKKIVLSHGCLPVTAKTPVSFRLSNGSTANAGELALIEK